MKFRFHSSAVKVMSCQSSASATPLRRGMSCEVCFSNHAVDGSVFMKFRNSAQAKFGFRNSPKKGMSSGMFRNSAVEGNVFIKLRFHKSALKIM